MTCLADKTNHPVRSFLFRILSGSRSSGSKSSDFDPSIQSIGTRLTDRPTNKPTLKFPAASSPPQFPAANSRKFWVKVFRLRPFNSEHWDTTYRPTNQPTNGPPSTKLADRTLDKNSCKCCLMLLSQKANNKTPYRDNNFL